MRYSRQNIIDQHIAFCEAHGILISQQQLNIWSQMPVKFLARVLAKDRLEIARGYSNYTEHTFN